MSQSFRYGITPLTGQIRKGVIDIIFDTLYAQYYKFIHFYYISIKFRIIMMNTSNCCRYGYGNFQ